MSSSAQERLEASIAELPLIDDHCHSITLGEHDRTQFEAYLTEAPDHRAAVTSTFDSLAGIRLLRVCAPVLGLDASATPDEYLAARTTLGAREASARFLGRAGVAMALVDGGYRSDDLLDDGAYSALSGTQTRSVVRLEALGERLLGDDPDPSTFPNRFREALREAARSAVGLKSVAAYRSGLELWGRAPSDEETKRAVAHDVDAGHARGSIRLAHQVTESFLVHTALEVTSLPIQFHVGLGDPELTLHKVDPSLLTPLIETAAASERTIILLHCYPFHRNAAFLSYVYPNVYLDLGLALNFVGSRATAIFTETMELAPFAKMLYSSDAFGIAELHYLGAHQFREAIGHWLGGLMDTEGLSESQCLRIARMMASENARRAYGLDDFDVEGHAPLP